MSMNIKGAKKMRGFMCQPPSVKGSCMADDLGSSVMVPRTRRTLGGDHHHVRLASKTRYTRLVDQQPPPHTTTSASRTRSNISVLSIKKADDHDHQEKALPTADQLFQVVVMRVSLHCQGCAGKVKRHLSKMEGVTSFSIDLESKRVAVTGNVSPVGVLESVSKVKRAEFWPR